MEKKVRITKDSLARENAVLSARIKAWENNDEERRKTLSELLDSYEYVAPSYGYTTNRKKQTVVQPWLGIAFLIGELKADADYAICIQARENLKQENGELHQKIRELQNPPKQI